jgi:phospholipid-binding lipoprotein MlaA
MQKTTSLAMVFSLYLIFCLLGSSIPASAQLFDSQDQSVSLQPGQEEQKVWDPLERSNRKVFYFNDLLYTDVVKPMTVVYKELPSSVRKVVRNGFQNLEAPSRFVNLVLQGKPRGAGDEMTRFILNSTVGVGGMFDVAHNALGVQDRDADFGQTLAAWCVAPGPYLVVPGLGPSDTRDILAFAAEDVMDPLFWVPGPFWITWPASFVKYTAKASDHIDQYETLKKASLDPYVAVRNAYMQHRNDMTGSRSLQPAGEASADDNERQAEADRQAATVAKTEPLAQPRAVKLQPRKNAPPRELAEALREAAENESNHRPFEAVLQQYPQLAGAVAARNAIAQNAAFRPDWGRDNRQRLILATELICGEVARGDRFTRGGNDPRLRRFRTMACNQQRKQNTDQVRASL